MFEEDALLGICDLRIATRHAEEERVEKVRIGDEPSDLAVGAVEPVRIRVIDGVDIPPLAGNRPHRTTTLHDVVPIGFWISSVRERARHSDDGDDVIVGRRGFQVRVDLPRWCDQSHSWGRCLTKFPTPRVPLHAGIAKMLDELIGRRMLEENRGTQLGPQRRVQGRNEFRRDEGVDTELHEDSVRIDAGDVRLNCFHHGAQNRRTQRIGTGLPMVPTTPRCLWRVDAMARVLSPWCPPQLLSDRRRLGGDHDVLGHAVPAHRRPQDGRGAEPPVRQDGTPVGGVQQGGFGDSHLRVAEQPPAVEKPRRHRIHVGTAGQLVENEDSPWPQQRVQIARRFTNVRRGMDDVGGDDDVGVVVGESLLTGIGRDVQPGKVDARKLLLELLGPPCAEGQREIRVGVVDAVLPPVQRLQHRPRGAPGTRPHLDHLDGAASGDLVEDVLNALPGDQVIAQIRHLVARVETAHRRVTDLGEQHLDRGPGASKDVRIMLEAQRQQRRVDGRFSELSLDVLPALVQGGHRLSAGGDLQVVASGAHEPLANEHADEMLEVLSMTIDHLDAVCQGVHGVQASPRPITGRVRQDREQRLHGPRGQRAVGTLMLVEFPGRQLRRDR